MKFGNTYYRLNPNIGNWERCPFFDELDSKSSQGQLFLDVVEQVSHEKLFQSKQKVAHL